MNMKEIATHFFNLNEIKYDSNSFKIITKQMKTLMNKGYTLEQIYETINYVNKHYTVKLYSFGFILVVIDEVQEKLSKLENQPTTAKITVEDIKTSNNKNKMTFMEQKFDKDLFE